MTQADYEQKKRALEEQLHAAIELLQSGYQAQLRALELDRGPGEGIAAAAAPVAAPDQPPLPARSSGDLLELVREAVDRLPAELTKADIMRLLGFTPERSTLHRVIDVLLVEGELEIHVRGTGRSPNIYRKRSGNTAEGS
jgi:hypothetical protein